MAEPSREMDARETAPAFRPELSPLSAPQGEEDVGSEAQPLSRQAVTEIDALLASFRSWLLEAERRGQSISRGGDFLGDSHFAGDTASTGSSVDVHTMLAEMIALRNEVELEARASKTTQERLDSSRVAFEDGLKVVSEAAKALYERKEAPKEVFKAIDAILAVRQVLVMGRQASTEARTGLGWRQRLLRKRLFESVLNGYELGLRKLDGVLAELQVEPIKCLGKRFDPETMEAVATEPREKGVDLVLEEIRPGYLWRGRVTQRAEVKVAAKKAPGGEKLEEKTAGDNR